MSVHADVTPRCHNNYPIFKSCLTRNLPIKDTSLPLQTHLHSVGQTHSHVCYPKALGRLTELGDKQGTDADSSAWNVLYITPG